MEELDPASRARLAVAAQGAGDGVYDVERDRREIRTAVALVTTGAGVRVLLVGLRSALRAVEEEWLAAAEAGAALGWQGDPMHPVVVVVAARGLPEWQPAKVGHAPTRRTFGVVPTPA